MHRAWFLGSLLVCLLFSFRVASGQVTTATVLGTVTDSSGAVVPGATVTVRNIDTGITRAASTDAGGRYRAPQLNPGNYEVTAASPGFQTTVRSGITLTVGREAVVDFSLQVGAVAEKITVTGEAPLIETTTATVGGLVDQKTIRDIPLVSRSYADLTALQPGVISDLPISKDGTVAVFAGGGPAARRSIGGAKPQQSTYFLDGLETSTPSTGMPVNSVLGEQLGVDAIREFTVLQSNYGAQYGRAAGGVVNAVTQSGTNEFHGGVFEFLRNEKTDARDFFLNPSLLKTPLKRNQFGGSVGGPIQKDRTFFFANYEGLRMASGVSRIGSVLTPETRQGRITGCPSGKTSCSAQEAIVTSTLTVDPNVRPLIDLVPLPLPGASYRNGGIADYPSVPRWNADENYGIARIDQQLSSSDSLFGRFTKDVSTRTDQFEILVPKGHYGVQEGGYILASVAETHTFGGRAVNTVRLGYTRRNDHLFSNYTREGAQFAEASSLLDPRLSNIKGIPLGSWSIPNVSIYGGVGPGLTQANVFTDNTYDVDDSVLLNYGSHSMVVGGNFKSYQNNVFFEPWVYGQWSWQTIERFITNRPFSTIQNIWLNSPNGNQIPDIYRGWRQKYGAIYFQDDFRALSNLTLNLGLRWERMTGPKEVNGKLAFLKNLFTDADLTRLSADDPLFDIRDAWKGFSPRIGFAWTPFANQKTVVRGGYGAFKDMPIAVLYHPQVDVPPIARRLNVQDPNLKFPFPFANEKLVAGQGEPLIMPAEEKLPYVMQWTLSIEQQLTTTLVFKANYVGTRGVNLIGVTNPDQTPTVIVNGRQFTPATATTPNPNYPSIRYVDSVYDQYYHAGQFVLDKRFSGGLRFNTSYTWSKNLDSGGGAGARCAEQVGGAASITVANNLDRRGDRGYSAFHVANNFIVSYSYDLPVGSGRRWGGQWPGVVNYILGGWSINGVTSARGGLPVNIGGGVPRRSRCIAGCTERPDLRSGGNNNPVLDNWDPNVRYFDPAQFVLPDAGFFGNVAKNSLIRPGVVNMNFSLTKGFPLGEARNLDFRAEFFNLLNHPNFAAPSATIFRNAAGDLDPNVGRITDTDTTMRRVQFGLKLTF